ncbi:MAG: Rpn family recombination-promoting nuclease/putative transposase [Boseongicola sp.]|nr:Rpn family recombination-promoting nuclease/putative transposase [Boseongicola sp.]
MADLPNPHDKFFRALLSDPGVAHDFLRDHLPNSIAGRLTTDPPEFVEGSFVDEALAGSQSDLLMKVWLSSGGSAFIYVLGEHKSRPDPGLPLQLASYMVRIWKRYAGTSPSRLRSLPPIIPIVVYHGEADWTVPGSLRDMIDADDPELEFLPGSGYVFRNLRSMDLDALSRNRELRAGFITLRQEPPPFVVAEIAKGLPEGGNLRRQALEYVVRVYDLEPDELKTLLRNEGHDELEAIVGTIAETLLEQGEARGLAKGEARGLSKGKAESLLRLVRSRFGDVPDARAEELRSADAETLDRWLDAFLAAESLDEVFEPPRRH